MRVKTRFSIVLSLVIILIRSSTAWAVDGVGLFETFPPLEWLMWFVLGTIAVLVVKHGVFPENQKTSILRRIICSALAVLIISPIIFALLSPYYVRSLCSKASLEIGVLPGDWVPYQTSARANFTSKINDRGEVETNTIPGLLDYYSRDGGSFGVWKYNHRLVEEVTGKTLLSASYFGSSRTGPMICATAKEYWSIHKKFETKAFAKTE